MFLEKDGPGCEEETRPGINRKKYQRIRMEETLLRKLLPPPPQIKLRIVAKKIYILINRWYFSC